MKLNVNKRELVFGNEYLRNLYLQPLEETNVEFVIKDKRFVSEIIGDDWKTKWTSASPVFICSQTGSGKTSLLVKKILGESLTYNEMRFNCGDSERINIIYFSNRVALDLQVKKDIVKECTLRLEEKHTKDVWEETAVSAQGKLKKFGHFDNKSGNNPNDYTIAVMKYHDVVPENSSTIAQDILSDLGRFDVAIFDEAHFFATDSIFNKHTAYIHEVLVKGLKRARRIYLSATMDSCLDVLLQEEINAWKDGDLLSDSFEDSLGFAREMGISSSELVGHSEKSFTDDCLRNHPFVDSGYLARPLVPLSSILGGCFGVGSTLRFETNRIGGNIDPAFNTSKPIFKCIDAYGKHMFGNVDGELFESFANNGYSEIQPIYYGNFKDYNYITPKIIDLDKGDSFIGDLVQYVETIVVDKDNKMVIFVESKTYGEKLEKAFKDTGVANAIFINAKNKNNKDEKDEDETAKQAFNKIVETEQFDQDILITTAVLDNGVNIKDEKVKHLLILSFDRTQYLQMLGRIRNCNNLTLYIPRNPKAMVQSKVNVTRGQLYEVIKEVANKKSKYELGDGKTKFAVPNLLKSIVNLTRLYKGMVGDTAISSVGVDSSARENLRKLCEKLEALYAKDNVNAKEFFYDVKTAIVDGSNPEDISRYTSFLCVYKDKDKALNKMYFVEVLIIVLGLLRYTEREIKPLDNRVDRYSLDRTLNSVYELFNADYEYNESFIEDYEYNESRTTNTLEYDLLDGYHYIQLVKIVNLIHQALEPGCTDEDTIQTLNREINIFNHTFSSPNDGYFVEEVLGWLGIDKSIDDIEYLQSTRVEKVVKSEESVKQDLKKLLEDCLCFNRESKKAYLEEVTSPTAKFDMLAKGSYVESIKDAAEALVGDRNIGKISEYAEANFGLRIRDVRNGNKKTYWMVFKADEEISWISQAEKNEKSKKSKK